MVLPKAVPKPLYDENGARAESGLDQGLM